ncbi:MAG: HAD-IA family hydrolase [Gammaproteobacteria bacterium]|nr:HAD-IA family hydrolase [Candidatus Poribacteria bacterium]MCZ6856312.1 HAD-IA family hydrolase [Gammaproteobacteria bacterium]
MIKVVFFDFFGTLIFWTQPLHVTIRKIANRYQLDLDWAVYDEARAIMTEAYEASKPTDNILKTMARQVDGCCAFLRKLGAREHVEQMAWEVLQYEHAMFSRNNATLYDDALPTLDRLQAAGLKMGIVSNWDTPLHNTVEALGIDGYFEVIVASHDQRVRSAKPEAAIFEYALNAVGAAPDEAVHVGDSYESDIVGAQSVGIRAILLDREGTQDGRWRDIIRSLHALPGLLMDTGNQPKVSM